MALLLFVGGAHGFRLAEAVGFSQLVYKMCIFCYYGMYLYEEKSITQANYSPAAESSSYIKVANQKVISVRRTVTLKQGHIIACSAVLFTFMLLALFVTPLQSFAAGTPESSLGMGYGHTLAVTDTGSLYSWGSNFFGQLGLGNKTAKLTPTKVGTAKEWKVVESGSNHSHAINATGELWAWGCNNSGQLGTGTTKDADTPVRVGTAKDWKFLNTGSSTTFAINLKGELWGWGNNNGSQLGDGTALWSSSPKRIAPQQKWATVASGGYHTLGITSEGLLYAWGNNNSGQLGDGTKIVRPLPVQISPETSWTAVSAGMYHSVALNKGGELYIWGNGSEGQLGTGQAKANFLAPTRLGTKKDWTAVACGDYHTLALNKSGELWGWGLNGYGQLGNTTDTNKYAPTLVSSAAKWEAVDAKCNQTIAVSVDSELYSWGYNDDGQLGLGHKKWIYQPAQVSADLGWGGAQFAKVTFNTNGGATLPAAHLAIGAQAGTLPTPVRTGYAFTGWYTALAGGKKITATTKVTGDATYYAQWTTAPAAKVLLPTSLEMVNHKPQVVLLVGYARDIDVEVLPEEASNKDVVWGSSDSRIASVDKKGVVTAHSPGTVTVSVKSVVTNLKSSVTLKVQPNPQKIETSIRNIALKQGTVLKLPVIVRGTSNAEVNVAWKTSDGAVATLAGGKSSGNVPVKQNVAKTLDIKALSSGAATISIATLNGKKLTLNIRVQQKSSKLSQVRIGNLPKSNTIRVGKSRSLSAGLGPSKATLSGGVKWTSSKPKIASIDQAGVLTAHKKGKTTVTLKIANRHHQVNFIVK